MALAKAGLFIRPTAAYASNPVFPDSIHQPHFPSPVYKAGERFVHRTVYQFS